MFDFIKGEKLYLDPLTLVVENSFYGFKMSITQDSYNTFFSQDTLKVFVYIQMINDSMFLYGFASDVERSFFKSLIGVSGIGPKLAVRLLSHTSYQEIYQAILQDDVKKITSLPGIGQKTAQKIILDLKDKISLIKIEDSVISSNTHLFSEAFMALENFGFESTKIKTAIKMAQTQKQDWDLQELIKELLNLVNKK